MSMTEIRSKLQSGVSIAEVCEEYHIPFQELFKSMKQNERGRFPKPSTGVLYISKVSKNRYVVRKGKVYYGSYYSLEDAIKVRDYFIYNGWNKRNVDKVCQKLGVERCNEKRGRY